MTSSPPNSTRTIRQRVLFVLRPVVIIGVLVAFLVPFVAGIIFIRALTTGGCGGADDPAAYNMPFEDVSFPSSEFKTDIKAFFIPGDNGVTLIIPPGYTSGRGNLLHELVLLHKHGYGALTYESRACMGHYISLGYAEVTEVGDALDYLATRSDVDMDKLAIHGFSSAGATTLMAAARYPQLRAVVAEGGYHDFGDALRDTSQGQQWAFLGLFYEFGVRVGYRWTTGYDLSVLSPISTIGEIAPRPILLIYGTAEPSLRGGRLELAAAGDNAQLWEVPGATHGSYSWTAPEAFEQRVVDFYDKAFDLHP
ncbi:MAG: prolyl oligopeptidase family serine peptidase [Chloroflexota bacterium]